MDFYMMSTTKLINTTIPFLSSLPSHPHPYLVVAIVLLDDRIKKEESIFIMLVKVSVWVCAYSR